MMQTNEEITPAYMRTAYTDEFHVLWNSEGGSVQECMIKASCLLECEDILRREHPEATYWEIGI